MNSKKEIDIKKTEEKGAETENYNDGSDLTHYLGNNESRNQSKLNQVETQKNKGKVAYGNLEQTDENHF